MPSIRKDGPAGNGNPPVDPRHIFLEIVIAAGWQQRQGIIIHPILMRAAQAKAEHMAVMNYFAHTSPDGVTPNELARRVGYILPDWYPQRGNNIESIYIGHDEPEEPIKGWFNSPRHHDHLVGQGDFYRSQNAIAVGTAIAQDGRSIWVFHSAPNMG